MYAIRSYYGRLGAGPKLDLAVLGIVRDAALGLDIALMHGLAVEFVLDDDVGLGEALFDVAHLADHPLGDVGLLVLRAFHALGAQIVVQDRRIRLHRLDRIDDSYNFV